MRNVQVFRASRSSPQITDGKGYTYHHHVDLAVWKTRLYCAWNATEKDEDTGPSRQLFSTSTDAVRWSDPQDLFPPDLSTPIRVTFYLARNGRLLAIAGLRASQDPLVERNKFSLLVREIRPDHTLGPVHTLQQLPTINYPLTPPPLFTTSTDPAFVAACNDLLANTNFLLQQDYGALLPRERRMKWNDPANWPEDLRDDAEDFGKATAFFRRKDDTLVAISKKRWVTTSADDGATWTQPVQPPSLITGMAKVWPQRLAADQYALVYNPDPRRRFPLVVVASPDGVTFSHMRVVHPTFPAMRYEGKFKSAGPQYVRGVSEWSSDHSFPDRALFVAYSVNKEDVWLARIPTPIQPDPNEGSPLWNLYSPRWAPATLAENTVTLEDADPHDAAIATRIFPPTKRLRVTFQIRSKTPRNGSLALDLLPPTGPTPAISVKLPLTPNWSDFTLDADAQARSASLTAGTTTVPVTLSEPAPTFGRLTFRTDNDSNETPNDSPLDDKSTFEIRNVQINRTN